LGPGSLDVIELDAATHGLVDDARDLRDKAFYAPVHSRYKIYIIDEAHQLGPGAANALLKVVEEPPPHVLFIFATTEPDKLISTIRSRTHHYPFRLVPPALLTTHLESICNSEGVPVSKGVLPLVVRASGGSVRDSLSILGQLLAGAGSDGVTYEIALHLLGFTDGALLDDAIDAIAARDGAALFQSIDRVIEAGHDPRRFAQDLLERIRDLLVLASVPDSAHSIFKQMPTDQLDRMQAQATRIGSANLTHSAQVVSEGLTQMRGATAPRLTLEFTAARILLPENSDAGVIARIERLERVGSVASLPTTAQTPASAPTPTKTVQPVKAEVVKEEVKQSTKVEAAPEKQVPAAAPKKSVAAQPVAGMDLVGLRRLWPEVIENVKGRRRLTWSLLSASAQISAIDDRAISIAMVNVGARDSFLRSNSDVILHDAFVEITGVDRTIEVIIDPSIDPGSVAKEVAESAETIENSEDVNELQGAALLARELGAKVIGEYPSN
jgi:DNA polymerase-3 subunit gamma/tau